VSEAETPGVAATKVRRPFLRRSLPASTTTTTTTAAAAGGGSGGGGGAASPRTGAGTRAGQQDFYARGGLEIKVCVRTYRLFYVSRTEDVLWRTPSIAETERANARLAAKDEARMRWLENFLEKFTFTTPTTATRSVAGTSTGGVGVGVGVGVAPASSEVAVLE